MAYCYDSFSFHHSPRTSHAFSTNGLVEVKNKSLATHLRMFLHDAPENWSIKIRCFTHAQISQPISHLPISTNEIVFHTQPCIPLTLQLNLFRNIYRECTVQ